MDEKFFVPTQKLADDRGGVERAAEQRRADVLASLPGRHLALLKAFQQGRTVADLLGTAPYTDVLAGQASLPVRNPARMYVHSAMTTVLDLDNRSGWVEGLGPVSAHQVRLLRPTAELQAVFVDPETGIPIGVDATVHPPVGEPDWRDTEQVRVAAEQVRQRLRSMLRPVVVEDRAEDRRLPSPALARQLQIRDLRCTGPGCPLHGRSCEQDHLEDYADGGLTAIWSLALRSRRCHHARHDGWTSIRDERTGDTTWISPAGGEHKRRSPWRPPPKVRKPPPSAGLRPPDGNNKRTLPSEDDVPPVVEADSGESGSSEPCRRTIAECQAEFKARREEGGDDSWTGARPWHTDDPPPF